MRRIALALGLTLLAATPALAGPPWISIEIPANPYNAITRNAYCLVRVYHHGDAAYYPVTGSAEGVVGGQRKSNQLTIKDTGIPGLYAVNYQPSKDGTWMLVLRVGKEKDHGTATVLVRLRDGQIASASVPTHRQDNWDIPDEVTAADVDRMLREQVALARK